MWTGWNPTTGKESTKLRADQIFHLHHQVPGARVRLVIRILRMRNTTIQPFYGHLASFPNIMNSVLHFFNMMLMMMMMVMMTMMMMLMWIISRAL